ncbi:CRE-PAF-1 protein [Caenorhabditis remanei]|uniref:1-alkyl-2-acetylglycerophosphocholine esterase n=1 Tax=Caenorhabditis remanei TaxID=31234 RepID=E3NJ13_CAERE|nr:CRE-PAF-1 protein [Caenorhabditis remanei]
MRNQQVNQRVSECVNALKLLENLNSGVAPEKVLIGKDFDWRQFENQLNISTAAIIGHSFGGATSLASASNGFQKSIVLDGWMFPLDACQQQTSIKPILFLNVGDWQWEENLEVMKRMLPNNEGNLVLTLNGGVHQSFSDFPFIFPNWLAKHFGVQGSTESTLCIQAAIELTLAFLENGKEGAQRVKEEKFFNFITNEIYGRERFKILGV